MVVIFTRGKVLLSTQKDSTSPEMNAWAKNADMLELVDNLDLGSSAT